MLTLTQIRGQDSAVKMLLAMLRTGKVSNAYLFFGPTGIGKQTTALAFIQSLNCSNRQQGIACGLCDSCCQVARGHHPNIITLEPQGKSVGINQTRLMQQQLTYKQLVEGYRVVLIPVAQALTIEAANSLLRIIEDPPRSTVFLLIAEGREDLLPTVVSRCWQVRFRRLSRLVLADLLVERGYNPPAEIFNLAEGSMARALALMETGLRLPVAEQAWQVIANLAAATEVLPALREAGNLHQNQQLDELLLEILRWLRDGMVWQITGEEKLLFNQERHEALRPMGQMGDLSLKIGAVIKSIILINQNVNRRLALEVLCLRLANLMQAHGGGDKTWL